MASALGMNRDAPTVLPLQALLELLRWKGPAIGPDECERVRLLLSTKHDWPIEQLQVALRGLLACDANQRLLFDICFCDLFQDAIDSEHSGAMVVPAVDVGRAMEEFGLPSILLIDKAPRDFPNDLLHEVSEMSFRINADFREGGTN